MKAKADRAVLMFEPLRLASRDPSINPREEELTRAMVPLLELIRTMAPIHAAMRYLVGPSAISGGIG